MNALGYVPAPGDPGEVRRIASLFGTIAGNADEANHTLHQIAGSAVDSVWDGAAALAFRQTLEQLCSDLTKLQVSYHDAGLALSTYATHLTEAQEVGGRAERAAAEAISERDDAQRRRDRAKDESARQSTAALAADQRKLFAELGISPAELSGDLAGGATLRQNARVHDQHARQARAAQQDAEHQAQDAERSVASAEARLLAARRLGVQARELRESAANTAAHAVREAADAGIQPRNIFEKGWDTVKEIATSKEFDDFLDGLSVGADILTSIAPFVPFVLAIGGAIMLGPGGFVAGFKAGEAIGLGLTLGALALKGAVVQGRQLQSAVDPTKSDKLLGASVDFGKTALSAALYLGTGGIGGPATKLLGGVKRSLSYSDNRKLSGVARNFLWEAAPVAPKIEGKHGELIHNAHTGIEAALFVGDLVDGGQTLLSHMTGQPEPEPDDPQRTREEMIDDIKDVVDEKFVDVVAGDDK